MMNLFGEPLESIPRKAATEYEKQKRKWENAFQRWSNKMGDDGHTHYGSCGFGAICDYCEDNSYGRPCVRALNAMMRAKRKTENYYHLNEKAFEAAFDGEEAEE